LGGISREFFSIPITGRRYPDNEQELRRAVCAEKWPEAQAEQVASAQIIMPINKSSCRRDVRTKRNGFMLPGKKWLPRATGTSRGAAALLHEHPGDAHGQKREDA
jgi:hypothetical protein